MLIRAVVDARLLGLRLLTLDARVVVAESDLIEVDPAVMPLARTRAPEGARHVRASRPGSDRGVGHARELLAQGTDTLADLRRPGR